MSRQIYMLEYIANLTAQPNVIMSEESKGIIDK